MYAGMTAFLGGTPVAYPLRPENGFRLDPDDLASRVTPRTHVLLMNSPHNPTGAVMGEDEIRAVAEVAEKHDLVVLSDEIYRRLTYGRDCPSIMSEPGLDRRTILASGLSKSMAMTGWRFGYGVFPGDMAKRIAPLLTHSFSCTAPFTQLAAAAALGSEEADREVARMREEFDRRRRVLVDGLNRLDGVSCHEPEGAFYAFPDVRGTGLDADRAADILLEEAAVATLPGDSFGRQGEGHLRLSYATSVDEIEEALDRIGKALAGSARSSS
jgi:aspartate/methionine/tyrosine aminotransferase